MDTRQALLQKARKAFAERGYAATSLEDLARTLGLSKAAVYHHFASKRALLEALLEEGFQETQRALSRPGTLRERLMAMALAYRGQVEPLTALMTAHSSRRGGDQEAVQLAREAMRRGIEQLARVLDEAAPGHGRALAVVFASIVHGAYMTAQHMPGFSAEGLVQEGVELFVRGLPG
ncbi:MAG: TetR/AcrR family transcriptional regulator [Meiothermus sp.]|uniref:TetR/AcrR family transcriptional regulator n=1 Tax=Meiothermus sp. TaxID=1955249 RepID=UPI0025DF7CDD|nr:TetR/AcrR family transcriptional regulator [Meiothermus sp.]MCS7067904.1 TetR/AcrR family transcriptional regulator [Meiothermus sp.]MCX7601637.1 TetR/AcrR family transcriptional regulator [Meiothermus sp.]MDW8425984.1 helix-turn-helix domain-containing protein [Meiothermus sp.]